MSNSYRQILRSLFPALLFMLVYKLFTFKLAIITGFGVGIILYSREYRQLGRLTSMDKLGIFGLVMQSVMGFIASDPKIYFIYPLVQNGLFAVLFLVSMFRNTSAIGYFSKEYVSADDYELMKPVYRQLTLYWSVFFILKVVIKTVGLMKWSFDMLYTVNWILGTPMSILLLWYTFHYPNKVYDKMTTIDK